MSNARALSELAISDNGFIFDPFAGATYSVNATGLCVLQALKEGLDRQSIARRLAERFDRAHDDLPRHVDEFILLLQQHNLLSNDSSTER